MGKFKPLKTNKTMLLCCLFSLLSQQWAVAQSVLDGPLNLCVSCIFHLRLLTKILAGKTMLVISFVLKGFPYKDQAEELFVVMV